jgi:hypothetical protein
MEDINSPLADAKGSNRPEHGKGRTAKTQNSVREIIINIHTEIYMIL